MTTNKHETDDDAPGLGVLLTLAAITGILAVVKYGDQIEAFMNYLQTQILHK